MCVFVSCFEHAHVDTSVESESPKHTYRFRDTCMCKGNSRRSEKDWKSWEGPVGWGAARRTSRDRRKEERTDGQGLGR